MGKWLIEQVRDVCVAEVDRLIQGRVKGPRGEAWSSALENEELKSVMARLAPDVVDRVLFELLFKVDEGVLDLTVVGPPALTTSDVDRGEYAGWFEGADGWRQWFAKERFNDYYSEDGAT